MRDYFGGKKQSHSKPRPTHHGFDEASSEHHELRQRRSAIGMSLALDKKARIDGAFLELGQRPRDLPLILDFMDGAEALLDLRLESYQEQLTPESIKTRVAKHLGDEGLDAWVVASLLDLNAGDYVRAISHLSVCVGGHQLASSLQRRQLLGSFCLRCLGRAEAHLDAQWMASLLDGSQREPWLAAEVVYEFIRAVRDRGSKGAWIGFFEGFSISASAGTGLGMTWNPAPMLKALVEHGQEGLAVRYEAFMRTYLRSHLRGDRAEIGQWQWEYDQHFQLLRSIQSGMFSSSAEYCYGKREMFDD